MDRFKHVLFAAAFALIGLLSPDAFGQQKNTCSCSGMNAESTSVGTCHKGEDTSYYCRLDWNGGATSGGQPSPPGETSQNPYQERHGEVSQDGGYALAVQLSDTAVMGALSEDVVRTFQTGQSGVQERLGSLQDHAPSRLAALFINRFGPATSEVGPEMTWAVTFLATYTFYPFAESDEQVESFARMLIDSSSKWLPYFSEASKADHISVSDPEGGVSGGVLATRECIAIQVDGIEIVVKGPRSLYAGECQ